PRKSTAARGDILESGIDQSQNLVATGLGLKEVLRRYELSQTIGVRAETEEPVFLLDPLQGASRMQDAFAVGNLVLLLERFTAYAVPAGVRLLEKVVRRI